MTTNGEILGRKFSELMRWEKRKRIEQTAIGVCCGALIAALATTPLHAYWLRPVERWWVPLLFFLAFAPWSFFRQRWLPRDTTRSLARMDKALRLEERAVTAWEMLPRRDLSGAGQLVLKEAAEKVKGADPRVLFLRQWYWQAYATPLLALLWVFVVWFDFGVPANSRLNIPTPLALAHKLKDYSRELQERAKAEGLRQSLQVGRELEKLALKSIESQVGEQQFKEQVASAAEKLEAQGRSNDRQNSFPGAESRQSLRDLRAELETAKEFGDLADGAKGTQEMSRRWLERMAALPQLKKQFEREHPGQQLSDRHQLKSFLDNMGKKVSSELDRRAVLDAQRYLEELMKQGQGEKREGNTRMAGRRERGEPENAERENNRSDLPGKEPGKNNQSFQEPRTMPPGSPTRVKGLLGEGGSSGVVLKGKPLPGKSEVAEQEVVASYRRQAEADLNTEAVPEALKETIKNYFLTLENNQVTRQAVSPGKAP